jgi:ABC-type multidrug transport system ATPase subunit
MLSITLNQIGKKYGREWIFRNITASIAHSSRTVILGGNGSGKSTLLQIIAGYITPNEGQISFAWNGADLDEETVPARVSFASPYLQLPEDMTLTELTDHLSASKPFAGGIGAAELARIISLKEDAHKLIRQYSSGMKQRLKLGLAILADTPLLLLDEPASNLDSGAIAWYHEMIELYGANRTIVVCSNAVTAEYAFCTAEFDIRRYKPVRT